MFPQHVLTFKRCLENHQAGEKKSHKQSSSWCLEFIQDSNFKLGNDESDFWCGKSGLKSPCLILAKFCLFVHPVSGFHPSIHHKPTSSHQKMYETKVVTYASVIRNAPRVNPRPNWGLCSHPKSLLHQNMPLTNVVY